ncbi:GTPase-activating protein [Plasmodium brasilianum]|uniref:GTPase-activating protein n=1 Tax=Plasmodium brasilianum TaxID=5824 RepID=A0ACB9YAD4_PLABR|nr:GTPase-activating protein [Plasmodium brasilianum]
MRINFFKEKNKIKLNKNLDFDSDNALSNVNNESNNYLTANSGMLRITKRKEKKRSNYSSMSRSNNTNNNEYDHYGFEKNKEFTAESTTDKRALEKHRKKIEKRWKLYFTFKRDIKKSYYLKTLIRKGIPDKLRPDIWPYLLDSMVLYLKYPTIYEKCLNSELEPKYRMNSPGLIQLRNVLHAFAVYKPKINYCQSMNFIAAIALIFLKEELSFWSIVQLIDSDYSHEKINISDYYNNEMRGLRRDIIVIEELVRTKLPEITTTLRIWDCLFYEGDKIIFRITLALFKMNQEKLVELNSLESILLLFKETTKNMVECDKLMYIAFNEIGVLKKKSIRKLRLKAEDLIKNGLA